MAAARRGIEEKIKSGDYYDAQQMVRMLHRRLTSKAQHAAAADLIVECAGRFSAVERFDLAADLGKDLVSGFESAEAPVTDENVARVGSVIESIKPHEAVTAKYAMMSKALKWSTESSPSGHPGLHRLAAKSYQAEEEFGKCQSHYVFCGDGPGLADMVQEWSLSGYPNEKYLFVLRILLILVSLEDLTTGRAFLDAVSAWDRKSSSVGQVAADSAGSEVTAQPAPEPALACATFLLAAAEAKSFLFFRSVRTRYALVLCRDSTFENFLDTIEEKIFGVKAQKGGLGALFEALLGGMGGSA